MLINDSYGRNLVFNKKFLLTHLIHGAMAVCLLLPASMNLLAEGDVISFHGKDPTSEDLINAFTGGTSQQTPEGLIPEGNTRGDVNFRGITLKEHKAQPAMTAPAASQPTMTGSTMASSACKAGVHSVAVNIRFKTNSSQVNHQDAALMKQIADAMNSPQLMNCYFAVEGHTDAVGEDQYNLWLSKARADSVKQLLAQHNVEQERMIVVGKGESELLNIENPRAAENRRVQFKVINPAR
jgi:outer membrane protein OmpA-like peptidoglycan-associated protein